MLSSKPNRKEVEKDLVTRIRVVEGHLKKVESMIGEKVKCQEILAQTHAIKCSLNKIDELLIGNHFKNCICKDSDKCPKHNALVDEIMEMAVKRKY